MSARILVVDDEEIVLQSCRRALGDGQRVVDTVSSGAEALKRIEEGRYDVVLLDIMMPDMNGIEVARHLAARSSAQHPPPAVIFVTAFDEHALQAFEVQALDYLLKPVRAERLVGALERAQRLKPNEPRLEHVARSLGATRTHITVSERGKMILVPIDDVVYLRAELKYVTIRTPVKEHLTEESLTSLEQEFGERFVRIHRNALVARKSILGFQRVKGSVAEDGEASEGHWEVLLKELAERLPISRRQWPTVKAAAKPV
jgi:two-component system response regulator AlgR